MRAETREAGSEPLPPVDAATVWTCPEHSMIEESEPGECPIGGRQLVARETPLSSPAAVTTAGGTPVQIDAAVIQNMNVRTEPVRRSDIQQYVRTVGSLEYDQQRMVTVTTKYAGWVEKVYVNYVGEPVRKGDPLFEIYSPELVQTEQELLSALEFADRMQSASPRESPTDRGAGGGDPTATRLLGHLARPDRQARAHRRESSGPSPSPCAADGVIMKRMDGLEGMAVQPGMQTFHIADLDSLWLSVDMFRGPAGLDP